MTSPYRQDWRGDLLLGVAVALVMMAGLGVGGWLGCAHVLPVEEPPLSRHCAACGKKLYCSNRDCPRNEPLDDAAADPCAPSSRTVGLLTPEERRLFCLHTIEEP